MLGNIGDFVGGIGVVVTLLYLATQIRQNTRATRAATFLDLTNAWQEYLFANAEPEIARLRLQAAKDPDSLSDVDYYRLYSIERVLFRRFENDFFQVRSGTFDPEAWQGYRQSLLVDVLASPGSRAMWEQQRPFFAPEFAAFIDAKLEEARALAPADLSRGARSWKERVAAESARRGAGAP